MDRQRKQLVETSFVTVVKSILAFRDEQGESSVLITLVVLTWLKWP